MARNEPGKAGPKGKPAGRGEDAVALTRLQEQWQWAWDEFQDRRLATEKSGRTTMGQHGEKSHPNVVILDRAASHLLAVSRQLAALVPLSEEQEGAGLVVLDFQTERKAADG